MKMKLTWKLIEEQLDYYHKGGKAAVEQGSYNGHCLDYFTGAIEATEALAILLYPKDFYKYMFEKVLSVK